MGWTHCTEWAFGPVSLTEGGKPSATTVCRFCVGEESQMCHPPAVAVAVQGNTSPCRAFHMAGVVSIVERHGPSVQLLLPPRDNSAPQSYTDQGTLPPRTCSCRRCTLYEALLLRLSEAWLALSHVLVGLQQEDIPPTPKPKLPGPALIYTPTWFNGAGPP